MIRRFCLLITLVVALPASAQNAPVDPARDRLFISPTARSLGGGTTRISSYYIFPSVAHGVLDRVNVETGLFLFPTSEGFFGVVNVNAKATVTENDGLATAVGANAVVPLTRSDRVIGTVYGLATLENEVGALTLGAYAGYANGLDGLVAGFSAVAVGLEKPVSPHVTLTSENAVVFPLQQEGSTSVGTLSGLRYIRGRVASDFALGFAVDSGSLSGPAPYLGLSYTF